MRPAPSPGAGRTWWVIGRSFRCLLNADAKAITQVPRAFSLRLLHRLAAQGDLIAIHLLGPLVGLWFVHGY